MPTEQGACAQFDTPPIENCKFHASPTECLQCLSGFYLSQNRKACLKGLENCLVQSSGMCLKCVNGYVPRKHTYNSCATISDALFAKDHGVISQGKSSLLCVIAINPNCETFE